MNRLLLLAISVGMGLSLIGCGSTPGKIYADCVQAVANGKTEKALACFEPSLFEKPGAKEKLTALVAASAAKVKDQHKGLDKVEIVEEKVEGTTATVKLRMKYADGTQEEDSGKIKQIDGKWYLSN